MTNEQTAHRLELLHLWLNSQKGVIPYQLTPLAGDASFRRYFRLHCQKGSFVVMDAPPDKENCEAFIFVANRLKTAKVNVPHLFATDSKQGFLLLTDFGDRQLLKELNSATADNYYQLALQDLIQLQACDTTCIPHFDEAFMLMELERFETWYLAQNLKITLSNSNKELLQLTHQQLIKSALEQPQVFIHRDYHSRNLMIVNDNQLGVIDFQDAMRGPLTYDVVSLLHDCYITWPRHKVLTWIEKYLHLAQQEKLITHVDHQQFIKWFDWMGLQRHLKVLGIFSRLHIRDGKPGYLQDMPRILTYIIDVSSRYPELSDFHLFMRELCKQP